MNAKQRFLSIAFVVGFLFSSATIWADDPADPPPTLDDILNWLPPDSETLIVAPGPFPIPDDPEETGRDLSLTQSIGVWTWSGVASIADGIFYDRLKQADVLIAVEAGRRFTSPEGLGQMPYEGCQIIIFDAASHDAAQSVMDLAITASAETIQIGDVTAAIFTETWEQDEWVFLVAQPQPGVLLWATNQMFLEEMLARMGGENPDRAFPDTLPEWQHVDTEAPVWAIRHYSAEYAQHDPSSPLGPLRAVSDADADAIGFVFWVEAETNTPVARYLTAADNSALLAKEAWHRPADQMIPTIQEIKPGIVEIRTTVTKENDLMYMLILLGYLGHGIYL